MRCVSGAPRSGDHTGVTEDAVRSETVSPGPSPCNLRICRDIFTKIAGESRSIACRILNDFNALRLDLPIQGAGRIFGHARIEQGRIFGIAGRSSVELRIMARLWRRIPLSHRGGSTTRCGPLHRQFSGQGDHRQNPRSVRVMPLKRFTANPSRRCGA